LVDATFDRYCAQEKLTWRNIELCRMSAGEINTAVATKFVVPGWFLEDITF